MAPDSRGKAKHKGKSASIKGPFPQPQTRPSPSQAIPIESQQLLLNIFRNSFAELLASDISPILQEVKGHLYNRDFATAFGQEKFLEAYAARWSPSRALAYAHVFWELRDLFPFEEIFQEEFDDSQPKALESRKKVVCLGGGAGAEIVAIAGLQSLLSTNSNGRHNHIQIETLAIDVADWVNVINKLTENITTAPPLSKYASAAARATNRALVSSEDMKITFKQQDIFTSCSMDAPSPLEDANLVTLMFTLNELYSASISSTQRFLLSMTETLSPGTFLLVIDSPGSYSAITLNGAEKKYPMHWLLDHTLLKQASVEEHRGDNTEPKWEKIREEESKWFRLDTALDYPIELENMRMQMHLYRRLQKTAE